MGLRIWADETKPTPRPVFLGLTCDADHGFLGTPTITREGTGYVSLHSAATADGWSITSERVLCPECKR